MSTLDTPIQATDRITAFVPGTPRPQGSKRAFANRHTGKIQMIEMSKEVKTWRGDIRDAVHQPGRPPIAGPVAVRLRFVVARPKGHYRTGRNAHLLRDTAPLAPTGKPDVDKLARAVLDAISSAAVWGDDSQVVALDASKRYAESGEHPGVRIEITRS